MKTCFKCGETKDISLFYVHKYNSDGHLGKCIECTKKDVSEYRRKNITKIREYDKKRSRLPHRIALKIEESKKYKARHPLRSRQVLKVSRAVRNGTIKKPKNCEVCGQTKRLVGHHKDYTRPLDVVWVCQPCHKALHKTQVIKG